MAPRIPEALLPLFDQGLVEEVVRPLMSGKEASVFLVRSRGMDCVAKIYKDAKHRSFRQRAAYAEGRTVRNTRERRAMQKGSGFGKSLLEASWQNAEIEALYRLHEAGVHVPVPYHHGENVLLMELVVDANGDPAPRLDDMELTEEDALLLHEILIRDVVRMLCAGLVHGDLSQYNILVGIEGPVIIDFPQATDAANNQNSEALFLRDAKHLATFLGRTAPRLLKTRYGPEIWDLYARAELHPDSPLTGRFADKKKKVDAESVVREIRESAEDAAPRAMSAYQAKKQRRMEEARAAAAAGVEPTPTPRGADRPDESNRDASDRGSSKRRRRRRKNGTPAAEDVAARRPSPERARSEPRAEERHRASRAEERHGAPRADDRHHKSRPEDRERAPRTDAAPKKAGRRRSRRGRRSTPSGGRRPSHDPDRSNS